MLDLSVLIAAFLFSLPWIGKKIEKKYDEVLEKQVKEADKIAQKIQKQLALLAVDLKDISNNAKNDDLNNKIKKWN